MCKFLPALFLLCCTAVSATTVYKTVDENGVVGFSDTPPAIETEAEVLKISTQPAPSPGEHLSNLEAMRETTDRMAADRREREKHRAQLKEIAAKTDGYHNPPQQNYSDYYYPIYSRNYPHSGRPPYHPGYRPKPEHPVARPPMLSTGSSVRSSNSSNSQLMRPISSSRR